MKNKTMIYIVILFATSMNIIECCKTTWNNPQSRVVQTSTVTPTYEPMTTTVDLSERTTEIPTEIDFTTFETEIPTEIDFTTSVTGEDYNTEESTETNNNKFKNEDKIPSRLRGHPDLIDMYAINRCLGLLDELFCLNGGKCFNYTMRNAPAVFFLSCECAEGFMDERCDFKYLEGTHKLHDVPKQHKINTVDHHIYHRRHPQHHYESNSSPSLYRAAQVHPLTIVFAGIILVVSYCSYRMLLR